MMRIREGYDVVVCGGGTAGIVAAIGASRTGARTLLVERYGSLGGVLTLGMALLGTSDAEGHPALGGVGAELFSRVSRIDPRGATQTFLDPFFGSVQGQDPELTKLLALQMVVDAGVDLLFHSWVTDVAMDGVSLRGVVIVNKGGEELIRAKSFVDCTGDADIVARSGGAWVFGRPEDSLTQPVTRVFRVGGVDVARMWDHLDSHPEDIPQGWTPETFAAGDLRSKPGATLDGFAGLVRKAREAGDFHIPRDQIGMYTLPSRPEVGINVTRVHGVDGTDPDELTRAEVETQLQMLEAIRFLRKYVPGFENAYIVSTPYQIGVRETRHIKGAYTLTKEDVMQGRDFDDQVARGAYPLDVHDVKPDTHVLGHKVRGGGVTLWKIPRSYGIPLRCLVPLGVENVTVGGRCISATHEAAGSVRGQAVAMATGHAAGVAAALAARAGCSPSRVDVAELQAALREQGAIFERRAVA